MVTVLLFVSCNTSTSLCLCQALFLALTQSGQPLCLQATANSMPGQLLGLIWLSCTHCNQPAAGRIRIRMLTGAYCMCCATVGTQQASESAWFESHTTEHTSRQTAIRNHFSHSSQNTFVTQSSPVCHPLPAWQGCKNPGAGRPKEQGQAIQQRPYCLLMQWVNKGAVITMCRTPVKLVLNTL